MCGIMGYFDKTSSKQTELGATMMRMLMALGRRGPDSAGIAFYTDHGHGTVLRIKLGEAGDYGDCAAKVLQQVSLLARIQESDRNGEYLRLVLDDARDPHRLQAAVESVDPHVEVISLGRSLEVIKQTGSPERLDERFHISLLSGTHAIAHTRLSTESRIDLSHSQPFWAHGSLDVASVHNGHITNYHKLRRQYEQRDVRFYTENDSEIIGIVLAESLAAGATFREALSGSLQLFDGSFSYLAATAEEIGFAKDRFGFKPLIVTESDEFVALATEEHALRRAFGEEATTWEPPPGVVRTWRIDERASSARADLSDQARATPLTALESSDRTVARVGAAMGVVDCEGQTTREINTAIRGLAAAGDLEIRVRHPAARHNLGVGLTVPVRLIFEGSVGYYCGGMGDGPVIEVHGSAGWGTAECILGGTVIVERNAGAGAAAAIRGGTVVIRGDVSARGGISMKGGTLVIGGNTGYMTGFMMQKGTVIVLGDTGEALGDSLYEGRIFVGGRIGELGNDAVVAPLNVDDERDLDATLRPFGYEAARYDFKKIVSGRRLWNFDKKDFEAWKVAL